MIAQSRSTAFSPVDSFVSDRASAATVCVIGAGIAGLACARRLASRNAKVVVLDKGRRPGGRASTRGEGASAFDHGAQYLTARDPRFLHEVESWRRAGIAAEWDGRIGLLRAGSITQSSHDTRRFVGCPSMDAIARHLARGLDVRCETRVVSIEGTASRWWTILDSGARIGPFEHVLVSAPPPQAAELIGVSSRGIARRLRTVCVRPCWTLMAEFAEPLPLELDGAFVHDSDLTWISREASRPERAPGERWVLHASADWSDAHLEADDEFVVRELTRALRSATAQPLPPMLRAVAHRWRFATPEVALTESYLLDVDSGLGVCGDALGGPRVEGAWLSGIALADALTVRA